MKKIAAGIALLMALAWASFADAERRVALVIGNHEEPVAGGSDGVVPYESSHLEGAQSELIVKSGHNVQKTPLGIEEVRRILLEHK